MERIAIEKPVQFGSAVHEKAADIVVWDKDDSNTAYIIIECKKPKRADGLEQLKSYCHAEGAPIGVWTNGGETTEIIALACGTCSDNSPSIAGVTEESGRWAMLIFCPESCSIRTSRLRCSCDTQPGLPSCNGWSSIDA